MDIWRHWSNGLS